MRTKSPKAKNDTVYELIQINHRSYSHCIIKNFDDIIMYKSRKTGKWKTTGWLIEHNYNGMDTSFMLDGKCVLISKRKLIKIAKENNIYEELVIDLI